MCKLMEQVTATGIILTEDKAHLLFLLLNAPDDNMIKYLEGSEQEDEEGIEDLVRDHSLDLWRELKGLFLESDYSGV